MKAVNKMKNPNTRRLPTEPTRNWLDLPPEITANIIRRLGALVILESAQKVCNAWRVIFKDPSMWRIIHMSSFYYSLVCPFRFIRMCKHAIDRSQGQLIDISIDHCRTIDILNHIVQSGCQLKRLEIYECSWYYYLGFGEAVKKLPSLEEISLNLRYITKEDIEIVGGYCPLLKSFKLNIKYLDDNHAFIISKYMPQLQNLQLIGGQMTDIGLKAILDACVGLQSLDLRLCDNLEFEGSLRKRCSEQIIDLKLPNHPLDSRGRLLSFRYMAVLCDGDGDGDGDDDDDDSDYEDTGTDEYNINEDDNTHEDDDIHEDD